MSKNLVGEHSSNQHENDFFHTTEVRSARIKDSESNPNEFRLIIDKEDADALSFFFKDEAGNEGNHSLEDFIKRIEKQGGEQDGVIKYKQSDGDEAGFIFKFNRESFDVNDRGDLVITGQRKSKEASDASKKNFDEDDIFGENNLRLHRRHHREDFEESEKINDVTFITDTFSQSDWIDTAQDYHYNVTKLALEKIFTSPEYRDGLEIILDTTRASDRIGSRTAFVANGDINLDAAFDPLGWLSNAAEKVVSGIIGGGNVLVEGVKKGGDVVVEGGKKVFEGGKDLANKVGSFVNDYFVEPISNPETWKEIGKVVNTVEIWSEKLFDDKIYPLLSKTLDFVKGMSAWTNSSGFSGLTGKIPDLFAKDWSTGNSNFSLSLSADLKVNAGYSIPTSYYRFIEGDFGKIKVTIGVPITATFQASVGAQNPLTVPLAYNEIPGPSKTLTAPQSGNTAGGQVATKVKYGLDASLTSRGDASFEAVGGITPEVSLSASIDGVTPYAGLNDQYLRKSYSNNFYNIDQVTGAHLTAHVTPEFEISAGLYVPDYMPLIGGDKVATIGTTLSVPMTLKMDQRWIQMGMLNTSYSVLNLSAGGNYSVDAKFLETITNRFLNPIEYKLGSGNIASWNIDTGIG